MVLHINLFHEIQKEAQQRARDPFKLGGLAALLVFTLLVLFYVYRFMEVSGVERKLSKTRAEWRTLEPLRNKAIKEERELLAGQRVNKGLVDRVQGRFYWAPLLENIATTIPKQIQILSFEGQLGGGRLGGVSGKEVVLIVEGIAAGENPRNVAEAFRQSLQGSLAQQYQKASVNYDSGNALEETPAMVTLDGVEHHTARFKLRVQLSREENRPMIATEAESPTGAKPADSPVALPSPKPVKES